MFELRRYDQKSAFASLIFLICMIISLYTDQWFWLLIPFLWILIPFLFNYVVSFTEHLFWLMLILLPLSTELNVTDSLGLDFPDEPLLLILTAIFFVKIIFRPSFFPKSLLKQGLFLLLSLHVIWILITCFFSTNPLLSVKFLLAKIWYIIPFVVLPQIVIRYQKDFSKLAICLLVPMFFVVLQALCRHAFYDFSFEGIKQTLYPFFRNHVNYSAMLICLLVVLWCVKKLTPFHHPYRKWINGGMIIGLMGLILSYSRGAWIALLFGVLAGLIIHHKKIRTALVLLVLFFTVAIGWLSFNNNYLKFSPDFQHTIFHTDFNEHLQATITLKDVSNAERFYRWVAAANMIIEKPIAGFGPNNFYDNYKQYTSAIFKTWVSSNPDHSSVHNYFLLTALEQGLIGLILFSALFFGMIIKAQQLYHQLQNHFYRAVAITIGMVLIMIGTINFLSDLIETDKIGSLFWLSLGLLLWLENKAVEEKQAMV